ncbi:hypothetical protein GIB67_015515 [Kingdonia uniflora]|uniref:G-box binding protein multifunctional mosaic region domain-containing protein n=1 Tax=Kingdonia uniflora TaxID=39325 RepID=A0A7J7LAH5_9MAGN|nr:hypothetical protein GIB67_015515 [Kingdonia uniflora]
MGSGGEADTPTKASKAPTTTTTIHEQPPSTTRGAVYPDWSQFQAYSLTYASTWLLLFWGGIEPPSSSLHVGASAPYGTPPHPYVTMYPHGGLYGHPSMPPGPHPFSPYAMPSPSANPEASGTMPGGVEADAKSSDGKERSPLKRSKNSLGSLNMLTGKNSSEKVKTSGASANGVFSQSAESGSEGSSEGSDANSQSDSQQKASRGHSSLEGDASKNDNAEGSPQNGVSHGAQHAMPNQTMTIMAMPVVGAPPGVFSNKLNLSETLIDGIKGSISVADICRFVDAQSSSGDRKSYPKLSATVTGERKYDVYMGINVFGRGTYGGGQWTVDRKAGYGESDPNPKCTIKSTALDVEELVDQMELGSKFYVMGYSIEGRQFGASSSTSLIASASKKNTAKKVGSINPTKLAQHSDSAETNNPSSRKKNPDIEVYAVHNSQVTSKQLTLPVFVPRNNPTADNGVNSRRESIQH